MEGKLRPRQEVSVSAAESRPFYHNHEAPRASSAEGMEERTREGHREGALHTLPRKWQTPQASRKTLGQPGTCEAACAHTPSIPHRPPGAWAGSKAPVSGNSCSCTAQSLRPLSWRCPAPGLPAGSSRLGCRLRSGGWEGAVLSSRDGSHTQGRFHSSPFLPGGPASAPPGEAGRAAWGQRCPEHPSAFGFKDTTQSPTGAELSGMLPAA